MIYYIALEIWFTKYSLFILKHLLLLYCTVPFLLSDFYFGIFFPLFKLVYMDCELKREKRADLSVNEMSRIKPDRFFA